MKSIIIERYPTTKQNFSFYGSDAFCETEHGVFGVASSDHHYHLAPLAEEDVKVALSIVHTTLEEPYLATLSGIELLHELLQAVRRGFGKINMQAHTARIAYIPPGIPTLPAPADDPDSEPLVYMALLQLQKQQLSIAALGKFLIYLVRTTGTELIYGINWANDCAVAEETLDHIGRFLKARFEMPPVYFWEGKINPGDVIITTTHSMAEIIALAKLDEFIGTPQCNPDAIHQHLKDILASVAPESAPTPGDPHSTTKRYIHRWGAAWAIACAEED